LIRVPGAEGFLAEPVMAASIPLVTPSTKPEASMMRKVAPTKNHGRRLNVSHPKRRAAPAENSMAANVITQSHDRYGRVEDFHNPLRGPPIAPP
jgi:hypothetical protein